MSTEMDLLRMDERQREAWLMANRATVIAVGLTWLGMIVWELAHDRLPLFLVAMVPAFALFRAAAYLAYLRTGGGTATGIAVSRGLRVVAAGALVVAAALPLYELRGARWSAWRVATEDPVSAIPLVAAFLWPFGLLAVRRLVRRNLAAAAVAVAEPLLAAVSTLIVLWVPGLTWAYEPLLGPWLLVPVDAHAASGALVVVAANGAYVVGWLLARLHAASPGTRR